MSDYYGKWAKVATTTSRLVCKSDKHLDFICILQLLANYHPGKSQYSTALRVINQPKNRSPDLLATDSARVFLNPGGEMDGDDYINASWLMGKSKKPFIRIISSGAPWPFRNGETTFPFMHIKMIEFTTAAALKLKSHTLNCTLMARP